MDPTPAGTDLSSNNPHPVDYDQVLDQLWRMGGGAVPFVFIKDTEGTWYTNPDAQPDVAGFNAAFDRRGWPRAVRCYLFARLAADSPDAEVAYAKAHNPAAGPSEVDWEAGGAQATAQAALRELADEGPAGLLYGPLSYLQVVAGQVPAGQRWLAYPTAGAPPMPCAVHQYTATGRLAGVGGGNADVDLNRFLGSAADWARIFGGSPGQPTGADVALLLEDPAMTPGAKLRILYRFILGRNVDPAGYATFVPQLQAGNDEAVIEALTDSQEGQNWAAGQRHVFLGA